jgi:hypothetical protein
MTDYNSKCQKLGYINLSMIGTQKRGKMIVLAKEDASFKEEKKSKFGDFYILFKVWDPSTEDPTQIHVFSKKYLPEFSVSKGDMLEGKFYV